MLSEKLGHSLDGPLATFIGNGMFSRLNPCVLTAAGLLFNLLAAWCICAGLWKTATAGIALAGLCDMLDGATARITNKVSAFGGFIDSVVDRYSDMVLICAIILHYAHASNTAMVALCCVTAIGIVLVPYCRARAETFIPRCNVGLMERPERIILIACGCLFDVMAPVLWTLAVATHVTVVQRVYWTWKETTR